MGRLAKYTQRERIWRLPLIALIVSGMMLLCMAPRHFRSAKPNRAYYYWKTQWRASPEVLRNLAQNHIGRLYMRFFDVEWDDSVQAPQPVSPLRFESGLP